MPPTPNKEYVIVALRCIYLIILTVMTSIGLDSLHLPVFLYIFLSLVMGWTTGAIARTFALERLDKQVMERRIEEIKRISKEHDERVAAIMKDLMDSVRPSSASIRSVPKKPEVPN